MAVSQSQLRASKKYHAKFERIVTRVVPEKKTEIECHAAKMNESVNVFVQRAIAVAMERDNAEKCQTQLRPSGSRMGMFLGQFERQMTAMKSCFGGSKYWLRVLNRAFAALGAHPYDPELTFG